MTNKEKFLLSEFVSKKIGVYFYDISKNLIDAQRVLNDFVIEKENNREEPQKPQAIKFPTEEDAKFIFHNYQTEIKQRTAETEQAFVKGYEFCKLAVKYANELPREPEE